MINHLDKMRNAGDGSFELVMRNVVFGAQKKAFFAACGVASKGTFNISEVDSRKLEGEVQREDEKLRAWKEANGFETEALPEIETAEDRLNDWVSVIHWAFAHGVQTPYTFAEVAAIQERYANNPNLSYRVKQLKELHDAYKRPYTEEGLIAVAQIDADRWAEFLSVNSDRAVSACEDRMYGKLVPLSEPVGFDRFVRDQIRKSIDYAWDGVLRDNPVAKSNFGILETWRLADR